MEIYLQVKKKKKKPNKTRTFNYFPKECVFDRQVICVVTIRVKQKGIKICIQQMYNSSFLKCSSSLLLSIKTK